MKNRVFLNIPHASLKLVKEFKRREKLISDEDIIHFNYDMTDLYTHKLFSYRNFKHIKESFSRISCDVEKFEDDEKEVMAQYGLGVIYKNDLYKRPIFKSEFKNYRKIVLKKYYTPFHRKLDKSIKALLKKGKVILVDCHSFSENIILDDAKKENLPDICIGHCKDYCSEELIDFACTYFKNLGYKIGINYPYEGAIVPNSLMKNPNSNFSSIMLEVNKSLYLDGYKRSKHFEILKSQIKTFLKSLANFENEL